MNAMIHFYGMLLLLLAALVTAGHFLWDEYRGVENAPRRYFLPLTIALFVLIALIAPTPVSVYYKAAILLGLLLTLLGNVLALLPGTPPVVQKAHWLLAVLLFTTAFAALHPAKWPTPWLLLLLLYGGAIAWLIAPRLAELQITILVYGLLLFLMSWQALEALVVVGQGWVLLPFIGALLLVIADSLQALHQFYRTLPATKMLTPALLLLGQLLLALSVWGAGLGSGFIGS
jgi:uncharacterized membrane protein YhhN